MWDFAIAIPLISLLVERLLEFFDLWVILVLFPRWRSAPKPPPKRIIQKPSRLEWERYQRAPAGGQVKKPKLVYTTGQNTVDLPVNTFREAMACYESETALYRNQLKHYILKWGWFLLESKPGKSGQKSQTPTRAKGRELAMTSSGSVWTPLRLGVEAYLAGKQGILKEDETTHFAQDARQMVTQNTAEYTDRTLVLEQVADYCYLRNVCTYEEFTFRKRQLYLVLGIALGMALTQLLRSSLFSLLGALPAPALNTAGALSNRVWTSASFFFQRWAAGTDPGVYWAAGALAGIGSQPVHGLTNVVVNLPYGRRGYPSADIRGQDFRALQARR